MLNVPIDRKGKSLIEKALYPALFNINKAEVQFINRYGPTTYRVMWQHFGDRLLQRLALTRQAEFHRHWLKYCARHAAPRFQDYFLEYQDVVITAEKGNRG